MTAMRRFSGDFSTAVSPLIPLETKNTGQEELTRFMAALNRETIPAEIIKQGAACLKETTGHSLFAFAIRNGNRIDVWGEPGTGNQPFKALLLNDFNVTGTASLTLQTHRFHPDGKNRRLPPRNLVSYETGRRERLSKIYMIPGRKRSGYHADIANIVLKSCSQAVSRRMTIRNHLAKVI